MSAELKFAYLMVSLLLSLPLSLLVVRLLRRAFFKRGGYGLG